MDSHAFHHDRDSTDTAADAGPGAESFADAFAGRPAWWSRLEDRLHLYVNEQPGRAALMALGAGALAALWLGRGPRGRSRKD